jgi:hypothetical protein
MQEIKRGNDRAIRHLRKRCQQRGIRKLDFQALLDWADRVVAVGGGRVAITLTRRAARRTSRRGRCRGSLLYVAESLCL